MAILVFIRDVRLGSRQALLIRRTLRRLPGRAVGRERLGEHAIDLIGPTAVMFDDSIDHLGHAFPPGVIGRPYEEVDAGVGNSTMRRATTFGARQRFSGLPVVRPLSLHSRRSADLADLAYSSGSTRRSRLVTPRRSLLSRRRRFSAADGLVGRRGTGGTAARRISSTSRDSASSRLRPWVRWRCAVMTRTPSRVSRRPASRSSRARTASGSDGERRTSKRSWTAVATLLTFWPPAPDAWMKLSAISVSSMAMPAVMS